MKLAAVLALVSGGGARSCAGCIHFCRDRRGLEAELPGLSALSSAHASVRADDGLCRLHQSLTNGRRACAAFTDTPSARRHEIVS